MLSLHREFHSHPGLTEMQIASLRKRGISGRTLFNTLAVRTATVRFTPPLYEPAQNSDEGARTALLVPAYDGEDMVDIVAVDPRQPDQFGTRDGRAALLGEVDYAPIMGGALRVFRNPITWLAADADGVVIIRPERARAMLRDAPNLIPENLAHGKQLREWLTPPPWPGSIFLIDEQRDEAAA